MAQPPPPTLVDGPATAGGPDIADPVPVRLMVCGLPVALVAIPIDASRAPAAVGKNVTEMTQEPDAATGDAVEHAFATFESIVYSLALVPAFEISLILSPFVLLVLVIVTDFAALGVLRLWLVKSSDASSRVGAESSSAAPVPERLIVCVVPGVLLALSVMMIVAFFAPIEFG